MFALAQSTYIMHYICLYRSLNNFCSWAVECVCIELFGIQQYLPIFGFIECANLGFSWRYLYFIRKFRNRARLTFFVDAGRCFNVIIFDFQFWGVLYFILF